MKEEDKKLKEIFKREIDGLSDGIPEFWLTMEKVEEKPDTNWFTLKIAASVLLLIAAGVLLVVRNQDSKPENYSLAEWDEPTRELMTLSPYSDSSTISTWSSPTAFLLLNNTRQIKN